MKYILLILMVICSGCGKAEPRTGFYIDWAFSDQYAREIDSCLESWKLETLCIDTANKKHGIKGFIRNGVMLSCVVHAATPLEKKACGDQNEMRLLSINKKRQEQRSIIKARTPGSAKSSKICFLQD